MSKLESFRAAFAGGLVGMLLVIAVAVVAVASAAVIAFVLGYLLGIGHFAIAVLGWILAPAGLALVLPWVVRTAREMAAG